MSNAAAAELPAPAPKGKKKLIIIAAAALLLLLSLLGGGAMLLLKKSAPDADEDAVDETSAQVEPGATGKAKPDPKAVPSFVPLDPFTVNLADRESERYAQISVTLQVIDAKAGEKVKAFLPAVRNNILMVLAHKTSEQLLQREGKTALADEIRRETARALGVEVDSAEADEPAAQGKKKKPKKKEPVVLPVTAVHFSNFIVQ